MLVLLTYYLVLISPVEPPTNCVAEA